MAGINRINHYSNSGNLSWEYAMPWGNIMAIVYSRDDSTIILGTDGNTVAALDKDGRVLWNAKVGFWVQSGGVSGDGSIIAAGSMDKNLYMYDHGGSLLESYMVNDMMEAHSLAVSGDGSRVIAIDSSKIYAFDPYNLNPAVTTTPATGITTTTVPPAGTTMMSTPAAEVQALETTAAPTPVVTATPPATTIPVSTQAPVTTKADIPLVLVLLSLGSSGS